MFVCLQVDNSTARTHGWLINNINKEPHLITNQYVDASGTLFKDLVYLSGRDVEQLSDLLSQLSGCELLQENGVVYCMKESSQDQHISHIPCEQCEST